MTILDYQPRTDDATKVAAPPSTQEPKLASVPFTLEIARQHQREMTAIECFAAFQHKSEMGGSLLDNEQHKARVHSPDAPSVRKVYRDLIPSRNPNRDEQLAFEVDLDSCSGCKACVTACHHLNGLEADETWRKVGLLVSVTPELPVLQHVTTACHHCVEPSCLYGCPTNAYEKDPTTGIVSHLDDQCFGCQYCVLACPYEVPTFSVSKGIVRKCDMCKTRLSNGEAPACVQACPSQAIRITTIQISKLRAEAGQDNFLPESPSPKLSTPSTRYVGRFAAATAAVRADAEVLRLQHAPLSLVLMLVLTQMSVGCLGVVAVALNLTMSSGSMSSGIGLRMLLVSLLTGSLGIGAATFHLGRPHLAHRAILGWRHSWLSREALLFGAYLPMLSTTVAFAYFGTEDYAVTRRALALTCFACGCAGIYSSMRIYQFTQRPFWMGSRTAIRFAGTSVTLGLGTLLLLQGSQTTSTSTSWTLPAASGLAIAIILRFIHEFVVLQTGRNAQSPLHAAVRIVTDRSCPLHNAQWFLSIAGGCLLTGTAIMGAGANPSVFNIHTTFGIVGALMLFAGEIVERVIYFRAGVAKRMPGGLGE